MTFPQARALKSVLAAITVALDQKVKPKMSSELSVCSSIKTFLTKDLGDLGAGVQPAGADHQEAWNCLEVLCSLMEKALQEKLAN